MTITLIVLALLMAALVAWLIRQSINVRPWVAQSASAGHVPHVPAGATAARVGLAVFLAVVSAVFALTVSAYLMRMEHGADWRPLPEPTLLWINTGILLLASGGLQRAWGAARRGEAAALRSGLAAAGLCTVAFIGGQILVWQQLDAAGHYLTTNPANAFFFLLTALHAVHLLGGLAALAGSVFRTWRGARPAEVRASVELCALYWHFLLLVWAVLFGLVLST